MQNRSPSVGEAGGRDGELHTCSSLDHAVIGHIILFKLSEGVTVIWVLIMFYNLDVCNILMHCT